MFEILKEDVQVIFDRDPAARSWLQVLLTSPGLHAIILHRINHYLWNKNFCLLARFLAHIGRFLTGVEIHPGAVLGRHFFIDHGMGIVIGETAEIGNNCSIYHGVTLGGTTWQKGKRHPTLEEDVVVGAGAKILGPITIGAGTHVGSNAVVVKSAPPESTVVGIPGYVVDKNQSEREKLAKKVGFDAYAAADMPDPVANAIDRVLDQLHEMQKEIDELKKQG